MEANRLAHAINGNTARGAAKAASGTPASGEGGPLGSDGHLDVAAASIVPEEVGESAVASWYPSRKDANRKVHAENGNMAWGKRVIKAGKGSGATSGKAAGKQTGKGGKGGKGLGKRATPVAEPVAKGVDFTSHFPKWFIRAYPQDPISVLT